VRLQLGQIAEFTQETRIQKIGLLQVVEEG